MRIRLSKPDDKMKNDAEGENKDPTMEVAAVDAKADEAIVDKA